MMLFEFVFRESCTSGDESLNKLQVGMLLHEVQIVIEKTQNEVKVIT